jgi:hypothetical protein
MARGAVVQGGVAIEIIDAASDYDPNYNGPGVAFVPDLYAQIGDLWNGSVWTYLQEPSSVTALQFRLALNLAGLRTSVEAYIASAPQDVKDWWNYATTFSADNPMLLAGAAAIGQTPAAVAALLRTAAQL